MNKGALFRVLQYKNMVAGRGQLVCGGRFELLDSSNNLLQPIQRVIEALGQECLFIDEMVIESAFGDLQLLCDFIE